MKKTALVLLLLFTIVFSLSACNFQLPEFEVPEFELPGLDVMVEDGCIVINGIKTDYQVDIGEVNSPEDNDTPSDPEDEEYIITIEDGYIVINGIKTEYKVDTSCKHQGTATRIDPTCTEGGYDITVCSLCGMRVKTNVTKKLGHDYTYSYDEEYHWYQCSRCDSTKDKAEHVVVDGVCVDCGVVIDCVKEVIFCVTDNANTQDKYTAHTDGDDGFVFFVGNENDIAITDLFEIIEGKLIEDGDNIELVIYDASTQTADGEYSEIGENEAFSAVYNKSFTALDGQTVRFNGTGDAIIKIKVEGEEYTELRVRVVKGYNVTDQTSWETARGSIVLLKDITFADYESSATPATSKKLNGNTVYGNLHKITFGKYLIKIANNNNYFIQTSNGTIRDLIVIGPEYNEVPLYSEGDNGMFVHGIQINGDATIKNSYISSFRAPVRINSGTVTIDNTTIMGGSMANVYVYMATEIKLNNVTTIQRPNSHGLIGVGLFLDLKATDVRLSVTGDFNQHNLLTVDEAKIMAKSTGVSSVLQGAVADAMLKLKSCVHTMDNTKYFHAGILLSKNLSLHKDSTLPADYTSKQTVKTSLIFVAIEYGHFYSLDSSKSRIDLTPDGNLSSYSATQAAEYFISARS